MTMTGYVISSYFLLSINSSPKFRIMKDSPYKNLQQKKTNIFHLLNNQTHTHSTDVWLEQQNKSGKILSFIVIKFTYYIKNEMH